MKDEMRMRRENGVRIAKKKSKRRKEEEKRAKPYFRSFPAAKTEKDQ
jgi:hypothetical protein